MAATLALDPLEHSETERQRQRVEQGEAQGMGGLTRVQDQTTSLEQVEESREVAKDLHLDQEREVLKDQGPPQENQEVEEVVSKVEEVASKVEAAESKEEVVEKQLPALEKNCRLASTSARVSMRGSLARVWPAAQSVAPSDQSKD
jgi:vancomycin resistance protein YoaR